MSDFYASKAGFWPEGSRPAKDDQDDREVEETTEEVNEQKDEL